jgi:tetratricopeptide (TPR) repeat protein
MLVTSRRIAWRALGATVHVPKLKRSESLALLAGHLPKCDPEAADRVSALLGDLALAVEQVAAFCEQTGTTLPKVVGLLTDRLEEAIELGEVADQTGVTVATLWELSRARLIATAPAAAELLDLLALCAPEPLPLDLFEGSTNAFFGHAPLAHISQDQIAWVQTVGALVGYSLINRENYSLINRETSAIWVHRLVQAATRRHMGQIRRVELLAALGGILFADLPQDLHDRRTWSRWRELLPHVRAFLGHMEDLGDTFDIAGAFASEGPEQPVLVEVFARTLSWLCDRCASYLQLFGQTREALPLFQRALAIHEAAGDANDSVTAIRLNNLANVLIDLDRLEEAEELLLRAVARSEATRGADHPDVADALDNLARTLYKQRRPLEALALLRRSVAILEISLGPEHPKVADRLSNVAMVANSIGLPNDALPLIRRAMAIHEAADGHTHHVAADLNNLAEAHLLLGQAEEALPHFLRALEIDEAVFGPNHPAVASDLHNLAQAQVLAGRLDEAEAALRRALAVGEELHGTDDPAIIPDLAGLARVLLLIEKRAEAAGLYRRALPLAEAAYGTDDPRYHEIRVWLAMIS